MSLPSLPQTPKRGRRIALWILAVLLVAAGLLAGFFEYAGSHVHDSPGIRTIDHLVRLRMGIERHYERNGTYPPERPGLIVLTHDPTPKPEGWRSIHAWALSDGWGRQVVYRHPYPDTPDDPMSYDLYSLGRDGVISADDKRLK